MSDQPFRLANAGRIDRSTPVRFRFDNNFHEGYQGDTLASALLANGVHLVGRSFKYHRPRGILCAGSEEPNALMQTGTGYRSQPNMRATVLPLRDGLEAASQNRWPSLAFDIGAVSSLLHRVLPAGFYYKTFMWPAGWWLKYEYWIRRAAGLGKAPPGPDPDRYETMHDHPDILIVGAGPAGLAAALSAGQSGARVLLVEEGDAVGGALLRDDDCRIAGAPGMDWVAATLKALRAMPEVRVLTHTTAVSYHDHNYLTLLERAGEDPDATQHSPRHRLWKVRAKQVVLATGAHERPLTFADNDRPGIMLSSAVRTYVSRYGVTPGRRVLIFTNNDDAYRTALLLARHGVEIAGIIDLRPEPVGPLIDQAHAAGLPVHTGHAVVAVKGRTRVRGVEVMRLSVAGAVAGTAAGAGATAGAGTGGASDAAGVTGVARSIACDAVAISGGWTPAIHLFSQSAGTVRWDEGLATFIPDSPTQALQSAGACQGAYTLTQALLEGSKAGAAAARITGYPAKAARIGKANQPDEGAPRFLWTIPGRTPPDRGGKYFVDFQNDVTVADLHLAVREGYRSVEHLKRYTTTGMGTDQGKTSNIIALATLGEALNAEIPAVGHTSFRPPYTPVSFGAMAGRNIGAFFDPARRTVMDPWHRDAGARFEHVGQWMRAWYYPQAGETMQEAVNREAIAARTGVGLHDASTLGKIDIQGADAAEFLNRVYTNAWLKLAPGRARYGLMLKEDGMVMDDGVTTRLGENHFYMTTTTGGAGAVLDWLEEWRETEWPNLDVYFSSVTEQWAVASICGPKCRDLLAALCRDIDLSPDAFPFMSMREGTVANIPARIFRISFTGELSFEINVPRRHGMALWEALVAAGKNYDLCPCGTESMHVLRAEKGFLIIGQETDGSVTPLDLGMDWIVSKTKADFIGKRALTRSDIMREDRKQLVGLLTEDPETVIAQGAQIVEVARQRPPMTMIGHVTSSYYSPNCKRSIAMALIRGGRARTGEQVSIPVPNPKANLKTGLGAGLGARIGAGLGASLGAGLGAGFKTGLKAGPGTDKIIRATIVEPKFFDLEGERQDG